MGKKLYDYMYKAFEAVEPSSAQDCQERAAYHLKRLGWPTAAAAVERMSEDEWRAWTENRELPPWLSTFLKL